MVGGVFLQLLGGFGTTGSQFLVAHCQRHFLSGIHRHHHEGLQTCIHTLHIRRGRPVEESGSVQCFLAIGVNLGHEMVQQGGHVGLLLLQVIQVALIEIPVLVDEQPPDGIRADAIHPVGKRCSVANQVEALGYHFIVSEHGVYRHEFGVQVANPNQPVALHSVPDELLHVEVYGVSSRHPYFIQALVVRLERTEVRDIAIAKGGTEFLQIEFHIGFFQVDAHETEARIANLCHSQPRQGELEIADGMVVGGPVLGGDVAHGFRSRFAKTHAHLHFLLGGASCDHLDTALELASEVEQERSPAIGSALDAGNLPVIQVGLSVASPKQVLQSLNGGIARSFLPHDAGSRNIGNGTGAVLNLVLRGVFPHRG